MKTKKYSQKSAKKGKLAYREPRWFFHQKQFQIQKWKLRKKK